MSAAAIIAVDVGNARTKLGLFDGEVADGLPEPRRTLQLAGESPELPRIGSWLEAAGEPISGGKPAWLIASVNRPTASRLIDWLREHRPGDPVTLLAVGDLPLVVSLKRPDMVGVDRLLDAVAANRLREPGRPAVVVDVGTAITVDLISADGAFLGGAIMPGIGMSARALHEFTDLLPQIAMAELSSPPPALGAATVPAMRSGLFWGAVGAIRQLIEQLSGGGNPQVFLTGGAGPTVAEMLGSSARYVPHLTLAGIAVSGGRRPGRA
ncbi:MAG: type III pantothenate kinase [Pirellulales bacterium]|nr:type III pantothenate kinase [Pirellulales bacterium]